MFETVLGVLVAAVRSGTPILFAAQGEIFAERSGNLNLGLEGIMLMGAVTGFIGSRISGNPWVGILCALIAGAGMSLIHAFITITLEGKQIVSGLALVILGTGISAVVGKPFTGTTAPGFSTLTLGFLSQIPVIGPIFFNHSILVYISYIVVLLSWFVLFKTRVGLKIRAVGEDPAAAEASGINVKRVRYYCVILGGALSGLAGAYLSLAYSTMWVQNMTAGRGWIAIALVIFARWEPTKALLGSYLFGGVASLQFAIQARGGSISGHLLQMLPYIFTILVLVITMWRVKIAGLGRTSTTGPRGLGIPYSREEKV